MFSVMGFQTQQANRCAAKLRSCEPFPVSQLAYPVFQVIDGLPAVEQPAVPYVGPWAAWCEVASDAAEAAAAGGGKQYYGLAADSQLSRKVLISLGAVYHQMGKPR